MTTPGPQPSEQYGTRASFGLSAKIDTSRWSAAVVSPPGDTVALSLCAAPDAPIGRYILTMGRSARIEFILLFNPWCSGGKTEPPAASFPPFKQKKLNLLFMSGRQTEIQITLDRAMAVFVVLCFLIVTSLFGGVSWQQEMPYIWTIRRVWKNMSCPRMGSSFEAMPNIQ